MKDVAVVLFGLLLLCLFVALVVGLLTAQVHRARSFPSIEDFYSKTISGRVFFGIGALFGCVCVVAVPIMAIKDFGALGILVTLVLWLVIAIGWMLILGLNYIFTRYVGLLWAVGNICFLVYGLGSSSCSKISLWCNILDVLNMEFAPAAIVCTIVGLLEIPDLIRGL